MGVGVVPYPPGGKQSRHSARSLAAEIVAIYLRWSSDYLNYYLLRYLLRYLLGSPRSPADVQWLLKGRRRAGQRFNAIGRERTAWQFTTQTTRSAGQRRRAVALPDPGRTLGSRT
jgi:hypothetical protein